MTDREPLVNRNDEPEDLATLYSWANLHGIKYRDLSVERALMREKTRQRLVESMQAAAESQPIIEQHFRANPEPAVSAPKRGRDQWPTVSSIPSAHVRQQAGSPVPPDPAESGPGSYSHDSSHHSLPLEPLLQASSGREASFPGSSREADFRRTDSAVSEPQSCDGRQERPSLHQETGNWPIHQKKTGTPKSAQDGNDSRWFALKGVFADAPIAARTTPASVSPAPVLAIFSLAGGVGKTSIVATLGRVFAGRQERVLLVDTAAYGLLPMFYGAHNQRLGVLRNFRAPGNGNSAMAPVQTLTLDVEALESETASREPLAQEIWRQAQAATRILIDLGTASLATAKRVLRMNPTVLVPLVPDTNSVVSVGSIDSFLQQNASGSDRSARPFYVLNEFDAALPLHVDVRGMLSEKLGHRLLPFVLHRTHLVSEALAEGMTVVDFAPDSQVVEDYAALASWVKDLAASAAAGYNDVRWSEQ